MMSLCTGPREHAAVLAAPPHGQTSCLLPGFTHFTRFTRLQCCGGALSIFEEPLLNKIFLRNESK